MSGRKNILITVGFVLSISLISSALTAIMMFHYDSRLQFNLLNAVCGEVLEQDPQAEKIISAALKEYTGGNADGTARKDVLSVWGYRIADFSHSLHRRGDLTVAAGVLAYEIVRQRLQKK